MIIDFAEALTKDAVKLNLSEDPEGKILTVYIVIVEEPLKIFLKLSENFIHSDEKISFFSSASKSIEKEFELTDLTEQIEFISNNKSFSVKIYTKPEDFNGSNFQNETDEIKSRVKID